MKRLGSKCFVGMLACLCLFAFVCPAFSQEPIIKLKYSNFFPPMSGLSGVAEQWCKEIEKRTDGRVKILYMPGGTLSPANQSYEATVKGIADITMTATQWTAGRFPMSEGLHLPLGFKNSAQGTKLLNAWYKKFKPKEFSDTKPLYFFASAPNVFLTKKQYKSINDLKNVKIRAAGDTSRIVAAMGAVPVSIPIADAYEAFQRGIAEGVLLSCEGLKSFRWGEILKGLQENEGIGSISVLLTTMNLKRWNSLPPDIQKIFEQVSEEWIEKTGVAWAQIDKEAVEFAKSKGLKVTKISKEEEVISAQKVKPLIDEYIDRAKKQGLPGEESIQFAMEFLKANP